MDSTARFWDDLAEDYAKKPVENLPAYERKLEITRSRLRATDVVLDIGCGTGSLAMELAPHVARVHAVDVSSEMVKIGRAKADAAGFTNVTFHAKPFHDLEAFDPGTFDVVCAFNIIHLLPDRQGALREMARLLGADGTLITTTVCLGEDWMPYSLILPAMRLIGKAPPVWIFKTAQLEAELVEAGFEALERPDVGGARNHPFMLARKRAAD